MEVSHSHDFPMGYIEKHCNAKQWIEEPADCKSMYTSYKAGGTITLWCECVDERDTDQSKNSGNKKRKRKKQTHHEEIMKMK